MRSALDIPGITRSRSTRIAAAIVMALMLGSCGSDSSTATEAPTAAEAQAATPPSTAGGAGAEWGDMTKVADLGDGVTMAACEGDAPFLCVSRGTEVIGVVEGLRFPIASFTNLDPSVAIRDNLRTIAADLVESVRADRATGYAPGYSVEALPASDFVLGGFEALSYGYVGTNGDGSPSELNLQYATIEGGDIVLVTAIAFGDGGDPDDQATFDSVTLEALRPGLEAVLREMPLPPPRPEG